MKKILILTALFLSLLSITGCSSEGKLHITSDVKSATIFIDGEKKGIIGDGVTIITVDEGEHQIRIFKHTQEWDYEGIKNTFVADKSSIEMYVSTDSSPTQYRIDRLEEERIAREKREKAARIAREKVEKEKQRLAKIERKRQLALDKKSGTVTIGNFMWKRCSEGQTWNGNTCTGTTDGYKWQAAQNYAKTVKYAGYSDWRVPSIKELNTLVYCSNGYQIQYKEDGYDSQKNCSSGGSYQKPTINQTVFPNTLTNYFWSSSPRSNGGAWIVSFSESYDHSSGRNTHGRVRLVRDR